MLDQIPPEVVTRICEHASNTDLYSFLQVSKRCHTLAAAVLYRHISISLDDLQPAVTRWTNLLDRTQLWKAPRCVTVGHYYDLPSTETPSSPDTPPKPVLDSPVSDELGKEARPKLRIPSTRSEDPIRAGSEGLSMMTATSPRLSQTDSEAIPLAAFLRKLPSFSTLIWYSQAVPAPSLALLLRDELSGCKLHLRAFHAPCDHGPEYLRDYVQLLVTLPNLRGIWFEHTPLNRLQDLLQRVVRYHSSGLEEVRILPGCLPGQPFYEPPPNWNLQDREGLDGSQLGRLSSLQIDGHEYDLREWARCTDFSYLRQLSLEPLISRSGLETLLALRLSSLNSLALLLDRGDKTDQYYSTLRTFLCSIRPLSRLRLGGSCETSHLKSILDYHGVALRTLYLVSSGGSSFSFDTKTISLVTDGCKDIVELGITMRRQWDKPGEDITVLKAIGGLPNLSDLHLIFDASECHSEPGSSTGSVPQDVTESHIRDAFINSAIDADLAKAVFKIVVSSATSNSSNDTSDPSRQTTSRLRCMSLAAEGGVDFLIGPFDNRLEDVIIEISRSWIVERSSAGDDAHLGAWRHRVESDFWGVKPAEYLDEYAERVFRDIWPARGGDWFDEWQAYPLRP